MRFITLILATIVMLPLFGSNISYPSLENETLYLASEPFHEGYLKVSDLHQIYYSEFGNPNGTPVLCVHGGPGGGSYASWSSFFDLSQYHVIMFDQRGAMRSLPFAEMQDNTPQHSIEDMESLRSHLNIDKWVLFGGSWGSTLSLLYSEAYPDHVKGLVLRGVFLVREKDYMNLFYDMGNFNPEAWDEMIQAIGESDDCDLLTSLHEKIMNPNREIHLNAAHAFMLFDTICAYLDPSEKVKEEIKNNDIRALSIARAFIHYSANHFFIEENQILQNIDKIAHIPTIIVQGRYDLICPIKQAYELHKLLPNSKLWILQNAGHASSEPSIALALKKAMDSIETDLPKTPIVTW